MSEDPVPYEPIDLLEEARREAERQDRSEFRRRVYDGPASQITPSQTFRIEALRAAARVTAGALAKGNPMGIGAKVLTVDETVLGLAEHFLTWLEKR